MANLHATDQAAQKLHISPRTLEKWRIEGFGPKFVKIGRKFSIRMKPLTGLYRSEFGNQQAKAVGNAKIAFQLRKD